MIFDMMITDQNDTVMHGYSNVLKSQKVTFFGKFYNKHTI